MGRLVASSRVVRRGIAVWAAIILTAGVTASAMPDRRPDTEVTSSGSAPSRPGTTTTAAPARESPTTTPLPPLDGPVPLPTLPDVEVPDVTLPDVTLPDLTLPDFFDSPDPGPDADDLRCRSVVDGAGNLSGPLTEGMYTMTRGGDRLTRLARVGDPGGWSRDGARVGFHLPYGGGFCVMSRDGTDARSLRPSHHPFGGRPAAGGYIEWTADQTQLVSLIEHSPNYGTVYLELMNASHRAATSIEAPRQSWSFAVSPTRAEVAVLGTDSDGEGVFLIDMVSGVARRLASAAPGGGMTVQWSPDGEHLAWNDAGRIRVLSRAGVHEGTVNPTGDPGAGQFAFSPDSNLIAYGGTWYGQSMGVHVAGFDGSNSRHLDADAATGVQWTPDGAAIIGSSRQGTSAALTLIPLDGSAPRVLATAEDRGNGPVYFVVPAQPTGDHLIHFGVGDDASL